MDVVDYLDQGKVWITGSGAFEPIDRMGTDWRRNSARWMINHAEALRSSYRLADLRRDIAASAGLFGNAIVLGGGPELTSLIAEISRPDAWVMDRALYRALVLNLPVPDPPHAIVPATGR